MQITNFNPSQKNTSQENASSIPPSIFLQLKPVDIEKANTLFQTLKNKKETLAIKMQSLDQLNELLANVTGYMGQAKQEPQLTVKYDSVTSGHSGPISVKLEFHLNNTLLATHNTEGNAEDTQLAYSGHLLNKFLNNGPLKMDEVKSLVAYAGTKVYNKTIKQKLEFYANTPSETTDRLNLLRYCSDNKKVQSFNKEGSLDKLKLAKNHFGNDNKIVSQLIAIINGKNMPANNNIQASEKIINEERKPKTEIKTMIFPAEVMSDKPLSKVDILAKPVLSAITTESKPEQETAINSKIHELLDKVLTMEFTLREIQELTNIACDETVHTQFTDALKNKQNELHEANQTLSQLHIISSDYGTIKKLIARIKWHQERWHQEIGTPTLPARLNQFIKSLNQFIEILKSESFNEVTYAKFCTLLSSEPALNLFTPVLEKYMPAKSDPKYIKMRNFFTRANLGQEVMESRSSPLLSILETIKMGVNLIDEIQSITGTEKVIAYINGQITKLIGYKNSTRNYAGNPGNVRDNYLQLGDDVENEQILAEILNISKNNNLLNQHTSAFAEIQNDYNMIKDYKESTSQAKEKNHDDILKMLSEKTKSKLELKMMNFFTRARSRQEVMEYGYNPLLSILETIKLGVNLIDEIQSITGMENVIADIDGKITKLIGYKNSVRNYAGKVTDHYLQLLGDDVENEQILAEILNISKNNNLLNKHTSAFEEIQNDYNLIKANKESTSQTKEKNHDDILKMLSEKTKSKLE